MFKTKTGGVFQLLESHFEYQPASLRFLLQMKKLETGTLKESKCCLARQ